LPEPQATTVAGATVVRAAAPDPGDRHPHAKRADSPIRIPELAVTGSSSAVPVWRNIKVPLRADAARASVMVFQPLAMMLVYTFAFSHLAK